MRIRTPRTPRQSLDDLLDRARDLGERRKTLADLLDRRAHADTEAAREIEELIADPSPSGRAYRMLGSARHQADAKQDAAERRRRIEPWISRALFDVGSRESALRQALEDFEHDARRPPTLEDVILRVSGEIGVSMDQMLMSALLEQVTAANIRTALRTAPPSRRLEMYEQANAESSDFVAAVTVRIMELEHTPFPPGADTAAEAASAATLSRRINETQAARVPDLSEVRAVLGEVEKAITRAQGSGIRPINPALPSLTEPEPLPEPVS